MPIGGEVKGSILIGVNIPLIEIYKLLNGVKDPLKYQQSYSVWPAVYDL